MMARSVQGSPTLYSRGGWEAVGRGLSWSLLLAHCRKKSSSKLNVNKNSEEMATQKDTIQVSIQHV